MSYLNDFATQLRARLAERFHEKEAEAVVTFAVEMCRQSFKNGLEACKKRINGKKSER